MRSSSSSTASGRPFLPPAFCFLLWNTRAPCKPLYVVSLAPAAWIPPDSTPPQAPLVLYVLEEGSLAATALTTVQAAPTLPIELISSILDQVADSDDRRDARSSLVRCAGFLVNCCLVSHTFQSIARKSCTRRSRSFSQCKWVWTTRRTTSITDRRTRSTRGTSACRSRRHSCSLRY